ncbi:MAG: tRNA (adenosine(37)-N6)-threonylcarbamoyltransferase complex transferase subunit TsaD [Desulfobulbaceae bacterium]|nr:tRNA (adenosine(37)-N6)-threonylcarbamoyltransferase complex transferase subunit TsaD [Desulfobulbaceae bacterium]
MPPSSIRHILGVESSCDDTAVAVLRGDGRVLAGVINSQHDIHARFGGVVPELASRRHIENIVPIYQAALTEADISLDDIDLIAATQGPGLVGSLLVGYNFARSLAMAKGIPFVGADHMSGHILSVFLEEEKPEFPYIALIVSGGTSSIFLVTSDCDFQRLGRTRDDAAGEAFDKVAKLLHLGYPGGPRVAKMAEEGDGAAISFPRAWLSDDSFDFSFSGVKTAVLQYCRAWPADQPLPLANICASFQEAMIEVLASKTARAAHVHGVRTVVLGGGVSANLALRRKMLELCRENDLRLYCPRPEHSADNAAMIAYAGWRKYARHGPTPFSEDIYSRCRLG